MKAFVLGLRVALLAGVAAAIPVSAGAADAPPVSADSTVTLVVDLSPDASLDKERLREAIARELGGPVVWTRDARGGTLVVRQEGTRIVVSFDRPDGRHDGRAIPLADDPARAEREIALLAGNVARDQTAFFARPAVPSAPPPPAPAPPVASAVPAAPSPPAAPCEATGPRLPVAIDFAPFLGLSTADRARSIRSVSLGAVGALSGGVQGVAVSGVVDVDTGPLCGVQVAGVANVAGASSGLQVAGVANVLAEDSAGAQIGTVNVSANRLRGVQIGVFNYARHADFQLGVVNVVADGRFLIDAWTKAEMGLVLAGVKHGGEHYHWIYSVGFRPADIEHPWAAIGLGAHLTPAARLYVDFDVLGSLQLVFSSGKDAQLYEARALVGYRPISALSVFAGPTFNFLLEGVSARTGAPSYADTIGTMSGEAHLLWPGLVLGVEGL